MAKKASKDYSQEIDLMNQLNELHRKAAEEAKAIGNTERYISELLQIQSDRLEVINELKRDYNSLTNEQKKQLKDIQELYNKEQIDLRKISIEQSNLNKQLEKEKNYRKDIVEITRSVNQQLKIGWNFLMQSDKVIKNTILNLGLSGANAAKMRLTFEQSAGFAASLGANLEDIAAIQQTFTDETGKAQVLTSKTMENILQIGKGTGLGVEQATKLVGLYDFMGTSSKTAMDYVQGVVDTSERMGVSTTKVLKNVSDNFKKLSTFTFQNGVKSFAKMAVDAERTRVSMATALNLAETKRGLEDVIEMSANLQVMGGRFAEIDPFQWLYMVRNEPEKINEKISDMTKGMYTLKRNSEGVMEKFISPADKDRLDSVAKSLGISKEEMHEIAQRSLDIGTMEKNLAGKGFTAEQKKMIEGAAKLNEKTGKYQVMLGGTMRDVSTLTKDQAVAFEKESVSLKERAKEAQTFEEVFKATLNEIKAGLLPLLNNINSLLKSIRPLLDGIASLFKILGPWGTGAGLILAAGVWKGVTKSFDKAIDKFVDNGLGMFSGGGGGRTGRSVGRGSGVSRGLSPKTAGGVKGGGGGLGALSKGAGAGIAAVGVGAGIAIAADGISKLADAMSKLSPEQAEALQKIAMTLAIAMPAAAIGIVALGSAASNPMVMAGMAVLSLAILAVGYSIKLASEGISEMAKGLAVLITAGKDAGDSLFKMGIGIGGIAASMALFNVGAIGMLVFAGVMKTISSNANAIERVGVAFKEINAVMSGSKEDYQAVAAAINSIANANTKKNSIFSELAKLSEKPITVKFDEKEVAINSFVTLNIDGEKFHEATGTIGHVTVGTNAAKKGLKSVRNT